MPPIFSYLTKCNFCSWQLCSFPVNIVTDIFFYILEGAFYINMNNISFSLIKEAQYEMRRKKIQNYCARQGGNFSTRITSLNHLLYNQDAGVSMCRIPKVGSSTWIARFGQIGTYICHHLIFWQINFINTIIAANLKKSFDKIKMKKKLIKQRRRALNINELQETWNDEENLSMVIVRHPLSRLG